MKEKKFGFLRETKEEAIKAGIDKETGLKRTGLDEYLKVIFPEIDDWVYDKEVPNVCFDGRKYRGRPDYRSEKLKMIIEFDGLPHYQNPDVIIKDEEKNIIYTNAGYKVIRIPYFIQLTNKVIEKLFNVKIDEQMFPAEIPSLGIKNRNTPAYLCPMGIRRMALDFLKLSKEQLKVNLKYLEEQRKNGNYFEDGVLYLKEELEYILKNKII